VRIELHPENPQPRGLHQVREVLTGGGLICYPTDSTYAYGWLPEHKGAAEKVARIRKLHARHLYALACRDIKQASEFGKLDNRAFQVMKASTPGPYTFILPATSLMPKRLVDEKRRTIGIRIPANNIVQGLLSSLDSPLMTSSISLPDGVDEFYSVDELCEAIEPLVDAFVDGGHLGYEPTTLINLCGNEVEIVRQGLGPIDHV
jgi:tRNA threonylcarbamoyl adenosine modification protein (Sua5/YciO/YrdC/YwlC family)